MLPEKTKKWLSEFDFPEYTKSVRSNQEATKKHLTALDISLDSEITDFYLNYGALSSIGWYELLEPRELMEMTDYIHSEFDLPHRFMSLTHHEGDGFSLLDRDSGHIYDVTFGQLNELIEGKVEPIASTFAEYLEWRRKQIEGA